MTDHFDDGVERFPVDISIGARASLSVDELTTLLGGLRGKLDVTIQFLSTEGEVVAAQLLSDPEAYEDTTVGKDGYMATLMERGVTRSMIGKSWNWLVRMAYAHEFGGEALHWAPERTRQAQSRIFPVRFTNLVVNDLESSISEARLIPESLREYVGHISNRIEQTGSTVVIKQITGGDASDAMYGTWKTFVESLPTATAE